MICTKDLDFIIEKYDIPVKKYRFIFNGDFVDRGPKQCEVLLTILYAQLLYPHRIFLNRGNHEDTSLNLSKQFKPNFNADCMKKFNQYGPVFFQNAVDFFTYLPIATILSNQYYRCFVVHGGISNNINLSYFSAINRFRFKSINVKPNDKESEQLTDLLWSDPLKPNTKPYLTKYGCFKSSRGAGVLFGEDISESFC